MMPFNNHVGRVFESEKADIAKFICSKRKKEKCLQISSPNLGRKGIDRGRKKIRYGLLKKERKLLPQ
jgi:hypothetical protein